MVLPTPSDDPFRYTMSDYLDFVFTSTAHRGADGGILQKTVLGPWLPKNSVDANAALRDKANPFRGRLTPSPGGGERRVHPLALRGSDRESGTPRCRRTTRTPSSAATTKSIHFPRSCSNSFRRTSSFPEPRLLERICSPMATEVVLTEQTADKYASKGTNPFGGDYTGVSPCVVPGTKQADNQAGDPPKRSGPSSCRAASLPPTFASPAEPANFRCGPHRTRAISRRDAKRMGRAGPLHPEPGIDPLLREQRFRQPRHEFRRVGTLVEPRCEPTGHQGAEGGLRRGQLLRRSALDASRASADRLGQDGAVPHHRPVQPAGPRRCPRFRVSRSRVSRRTRRASSTRSTTWDRSRMFGSNSR